MTQTMKLKAEIEGVKSQLELFAEIFPSSSAVEHTKTLLLELLQEELVCLYRKYEHASQKRNMYHRHSTDSSVGIDLKLDCSSNQNELLKGEQSENSCCSEIGFDVKEALNTKLNPRVKGNEEGVVESNVEKELQSVVEGLVQNIQTSDELNYGIDKERNIHQKYKLISDYKSKLQETDKILREIKEENEKLKRNTLNFQNEKNPIMQSIANGVPPLDEVSQTKYLLALTTERGKFKRVKPKFSIHCDILSNVQGKYFLFNKCTEKAYCSLVWDKCSEVQRNLTCEEFQENRNRSNPDAYLDYYKEISTMQEKSLLKLQEIYDEMLGHIITLAEMELTNHQTEMSNERKAIHIEAVNETKVLGIENNIGLLNANLLQSKLRLEFYTSRQKELLCSFNEIGKQSEVEQAVLSKEQTEVCSWLCNEEKAQKTFSDITSLIDLAKNKYWTLSKCVESLDAQIWASTETLKYLKGNQCRQKMCRIQLTNSKKETAKCRSAIPHDKQTSEVLEDTIDRLLLQVIEKQKSSL